MIESLARADPSLALRRMGRTAQVVPQSTVHSPPLGRSRLSFEDHPQQMQDTVAEGQLLPIVVSAPLSRASQHGKHALRTEAYQPLPPVGLLSAELVQHLHCVQSGSAILAHSVRARVFWCCLFLCLPPLLCSIVMGCLELPSPEEPLRNQWKLLFIVLPLGCLCMALAKISFMAATSRVLVSRRAACGGAAAIGTFAYVSLLLFASPWFYPLKPPHGRAVAMTLPVVPGFAVMFCIARVASSVVLSLKDLWVHLCLFLLGSCFFACYYAVDAGYLKHMSSVRRSFLAVVWLCMRFAFKLVAQRLLRAFGLIDADPYVTFFMSLTGEFATKQLFVEAAQADGPLSVSIVIFSDAVENTYWAVSIWSAFHRHLELKRATAVRKTVRKAVEYTVAQVSVQLRTLERRLAGKALALASEGPLVESEDLDIDLLFDSQVSSLQAGDELSAHCEELDTFNRGQLCILRFLANELADMLASAWALPVIPAIGLGPNREHNAIFQHLDHHTVAVACGFCLVSLVVQLLLTGFSIMILSVLTKQDLLLTFWAYLERSRLLSPALAGAISVPIVFLSMSLEHFGRTPI